MGACFPGSLPEWGLATRQQLALPNVVRCLGPRRWVPAAGRIPNLSVGSWSLGSGTSFTACRAQKWNRAHGIIS
jgi:hypothetical protein